MRRTSLLLGLLAVAVLAAVLVIVLKPFASAVTLGGPLGPAGNLSSACEPTQLGRPVTIGIQDFTNSGHGNVVIDRLALGDPRDIKLAGAYTLPGRYAVGAWATFPPPASQLDTGVQWAKRQPPPGTRIRPGHWISVAVGVERTGHRIGRTTGIVIWYHDGTAHYELRTLLQIELKAGLAPC
jgi:hypothetical protein